LAVTEVATQTRCLRQMFQGKDRNGVLPISILSVYSFQIIVPVVQRIEQGFPNAKTPFLQEFADVVSSAQTSVSEYLTNCYHHHQ
jgi:hypothetical protein